jgi:hypothetical protein
MWNRRLEKRKNKDKLGRWKGKRWERKTTKRQISSKVEDSSNCF